MNDDPELTMSNTAAIQRLLTDMAKESPRCVLLCIYREGKETPSSYITTGILSDPVPFSSFICKILSAAEEVISARLGKAEQIKHLMVETERFTMISRRLWKSYHVLLVLRSPVECLGMPIELLDRWEGTLRENLANIAGGLD
ncbi:MAG: hypothetical protein ABIM19_04345 [candidate division WOR-3 bacterium]